MSISVKVRAGTRTSLRHAHARRQERATRGMCVRWLSPRSSRRRGTGSHGDYRQGVIAILALAVALLSLSWNLAIAWLRWPRLSAVVHETALLASSQPGRTVTLRLVVINHGAEAGMVADAGFAMRADLPGFRK